MASLEMLGRLCAGASNLQGFGGGGAAVLLRSELAGLLAGLSDVQFDFAAAKYMADQSAEHRLTLKVWQSGIDGVSAAERSAYLGMVSLVVVELVRPNRCGRCNGRGFVAGQMCTVCSGTGFKRFSGRFLAESLGVDQCRYRRVWRGRYEDCYQSVVALDGEVRLALFNADRESVAA